mmetsp:Transcript_106702/g.206747  ORF Transcript_106702/g.206747 Transcript_106702/m.206747 type:complete len:273 (-) Transcript_106702:51-869(-)
MTDPGPETAGGNYVYSRELALKVRASNLELATPNRPHHGNPGLFRMVKLPHLVSEQLCAPGLSIGGEGGVCNVLATQPVVPGLKTAMTPPALPWPSMPRGVPAGLDLAQKDPSIAGMMLAATPEAHFAAAKAAERAALAFRARSQEEVASDVRNQIEYYFSVKNVCQDSYLRSRMDDEGWVKLKEITKFPKLRALSVDVAAAARVLQDSMSVEISQDGLRARIMNGVIRELFPRMPGYGPVPLHDKHGAQRRRGAGTHRPRAALRNKRRSGN